MAKYIPYDYNQNIMVVINFQDQLQAGTFEHALHYLVTQKLDLSIFEIAFKNDKEGRPAYKKKQDTHSLKTLSAIIQSSKNEKVVLID